MRRLLSRWTCLCLTVLLSALSVAGQERTVELFSGNPAGPGSTDGFGTAARFGEPGAIVWDDLGSLYVADRELHTIRRIEQNGRVSTVAGVAYERGLVDGRGGVARFARPGGLAIDSNRNLYVSDAENLRIRKISPEGVVSTLGGALPTFPSNVAVDPVGNVYISFGDSTIRKMTPTGVLSPIAGQSFSSGLVDGVGAAARFSGPSGLAVDAAGNLFVADAGNNAIRKITMDGTVTTFVIIGQTPTGVAFDSNGDLIVSLNNSGQIRRVTPAGVVSLVAGSGSQGSADGNAASATFLFPRGVAASPGGEIFVADSLNATIRKIAAGAVTTIAGAPLQRGTTNGALAAARYLSPSDVVRDSVGNLFVLDASTIRRITPAGDVQLFAGEPGFSGTVNGTGTAARFVNPSCVVIDSADNLFVTDSDAHVIRKITPAAVVTTFAGTAGVSGTLEGTGTAARFRSPEALTIDPAGNIYVADFNNHSIRKITPGGEVSTLAGFSGSSGMINASGTAARFQNPAGIDIDAAGDLYVTDYSNHRIRKITMPGAHVTTLAGSGVLGWDDGTGVTASFHSPWEVEMVGTDLYVLDGGATLRKVTSTGVVTTIAGRTVTHARKGNASGTGPAALFYNPSGLGADPAGNLYLTDRYAANVRRVQLPGMDDLATVSAPAPPVSTAVQLTPNPDTGDAWTWELVRRPAGSLSELSATSVKNPTFSPDVADLFRFRLRVAKADGSLRYSTVDVTPSSACEPLASVVATVNTPLVCVSASAGEASVAISGGAASIQWGYRLTPDGATTPISGATSASYSLNGADLGGLGARYLVATVTSSCGFALASNAVAVEVTSPPGVPSISAGSTAYASEGNHFASIDDLGVAATYAWSIVNGTIDAGQGTRSIRYTAGASGTVTLQLIVSRGGCQAQSPQTFVSIIPRAPGGSMLFVVTPCRVIDTRDPVSSHGGPILADGGVRTFVISGRCGVPAGAKAVVVNVTAVAPQASGYLALHPAGVAWGGNSTMNYRAGRVRANNAAVPLSANGSLIVRNSGAAAHVLLDVTGYFQ